MRHFILAAAISLSAAALAPTAASARDEIEGDYAVACLPEITCYANVEALGGERYSLVWTAQDRAGPAVHCERRATIAMGDFDQDGLEMENVPNGVFDDGHRVLLSALGSGSLHVWTDGTSCAPPSGVRGVIVANGVYEQFGDQ